MSRYTPEERRQRLRDIEARNHRNGLHAGMHVQTCPACNEERSPWDEPPCPVCGGYMDRPHPHRPGGRVVSRRPYRVRWWEPDTNAYGGASYSTRAKADFEAERRAEEGYIDVYTWEADDGGYMVPGSRWVCVSGAGLRMAAPDPISGNLLDEDPEDAESAIEANSRRLDAAREGRP